MSMERFPLVLFSACLALGVLPVAASGEAIRVSLTVSASEEIKAEVVSLLSREFRKLGDVDIADRDVDYEINVVALDLIAAGQVRTGYALSAVVSEPFPLLAVKVSPVLKGAVVIRAHFLQTGPKLQELCKNIAVGTDAEAFEPERKTRKMLRDLNSTPAPPR